MYPVDLVQVVALDHDRTHDARSRRGLHRHLDAAVEDVEVGLDGRRVASLGDGEGRTLVRVRYCACQRVPAAVVSGREVRLEDGALAEAGVGGAWELRRVGRVARGVGLGSGEGGEKSGG